MEIPKPPEDAELVNIIDKLANFVARNGPEFEQMTKTKQKDNPKFSFLFGGEYYNYYQYKVSSEQARIQQQNQKLAQQQAIVQQVITQQAIQTAPWQQNKIIEQQSLALQQQQQTTALQQQITALQQQIAQQQATVAEQIKQSDSNLAAQYQSLTQQQQVQIEDAIVKERDNKLAALSRDCEVSMDELDKMVQPIIDSCTKDSIMHGKNWILAHCVSSDHCNLITQYLLKRICSKDAPFQTRLHLIYLTNDLLHHCQRKSIDGLKTALDKMVVPAFCKSSLGVDEESKQKLNKLLTLWEKNNYFDTETISQLKDPAASMATYQASLITEYGSIVTAITKQIQSQYASLEKQHQDFCAHLNNPIAQMQSQLQILMAKQRALPPPATGAIVPVGAPPPNVAAITAVNIPVSLQAPPVQLSETGNSGSGGGEPAEKTSTPETPASTQSESAHPSSDVTAPSKEGEGQQPQIPIQIPGTGPPQSINSIIPQGPPPGLPPGTQPPLGPAGNFTQPPPMPPFHTPPPGFGRPPPPQQFEYGHGLARGPPVMPPDFRGPPPGLPPGVPPLPLPDFSRPPPGFPAGPPPAPLGPPGPPPPGPHGPPGPIPPAPFPCLPTEIDLTPSVPYYDLPAGLMAPLVKLEDTEYQPLDPNDIRLPPPMPPSERLLAAVEAFYGPPSHDRPRDSDGWEKLGLYEFFKAKQGAKRLKEKQVEEERLQNPSNSEQPLKLEPRSPVRNRSRSKSRSPPRRRRYASGDRKSRSRSRSRSKSKSPLPYLRRSRSPSPPVPNTLRAKSRSPTPPSFMPPTVPAVNQDESKLGEDNKGHMLLKKMGWGGKGLGVKEQGIENPIKAGEVRDRQDAFKGIGINLKDPFEQFRKSKSQGFIQRMKARDESREAKKAKSDD